MPKTQPGFRPHARWGLGILAAWTMVWLAQGIHQAIRSGSHPHPFLPHVTFTKVMFMALGGWAMAAWVACAVTGLIAAMIVFAAWILRREEASARALGFRNGLWQGFGIVALVHGVLYWEVPTAIQALPLLCRLPMGLVILGLLALGVACQARGLGARRSLEDGLRLLTGCVLVVLLLQLPHDLFRRAMPRPPRIDPAQSRMLVYSIDGCRQDVLEKAAPTLKAPAGLEPVVAIPATRTTWNVLLGGDPATMTRSFVIPFMEEWQKESPAKLLEESSRKGLSSCFLIDDSTTLSFGLTRARFNEVMEPDGGWKHFFTVGAGTCWPAYSWLENFLSPVETTNPWSDFRAYDRDVARALERHRMVFSHTCQLHAPFFPRREELQVLRPWKWFFHSAYAYQSYQAFGEAEASRFDRQDGRSNPINTYRIRIQRLSRILQPDLNRWAQAYPALSGVFTSDHGEAFYPLITPDRVLVNYLTGLHGFTLTPDTIRIPLHPFGATETSQLKPGPFSWFDLRQCLKDWVAQPDRLRLHQLAPQGWHLSYPTVQATHALAASTPTAASAGLTAGALAQHTYLHPSGIWFMTDPPASMQHPVQSHALVRGRDMVTFNPLGGGRWIREAWSGYDLVEDRVVETSDMERELGEFPGRSPQEVFPSSAP